MLAEKSLLSVTLAATFVAGTVTGYAARDVKGEPPFVPTKAEHVYARRLAELRDRGYDKAEMAEALRIHQAYLDEYGGWWTKFLDGYRDSLSTVDTGFENACAELEVKFRQRTELTGRPAGTDERR